MHLLKAADTVNDGASNSGEGYKCFTPVGTVGKLSELHLEFCNACAFLEEYNTVNHEMASAGK